MQDVGVNPSTQPPPMSEPFSPTTSTISTQSTMDKPCTCGKEGCPSCRREMLSYSYVYAIGKVMYRFPNRSLEAEFAQAIGHKAGEEMKGQTHEAVFHNVLTDAANRYIARLLCYVLSIQNVETYILVPADPLDVERLAQAIRAAHNVGDLDVIIGRRGPIASFEMCNGLMIPIVMIDQIYSFDRDTLMKAIPKAKGVNEDQFRKTRGAFHPHYPNSR